MIQTGDALDIVGTIAADDDAVGLAEVRDRRALAQEFGVRDVAHVLTAARIKLGADATTGADGHGGLHHQNRPLGTRGQRVDDGLHARQVGIARGSRWCVNADDRDARLAEHVLHVERERQTLGVALEQFRHARLMDGNLAALKHLNALRDDVTAHDGMAELGKTGGRDETDVADADDADRLASAQRVTRLKLFAMAIIAELGMRPVKEFSSQ